VVGGNTGVTIFRWFSRRVRPDLERRLATTRAECWEADYQAVKQKIEEAADCFAEYPELAAKIISIFTESKALEPDIARVNSSAPSRESRRLKSVEVTARGHEITIANPSLLEVVKLADWNHAADSIWPQERINPALFAPAPFNPRYSADWGKVQEAERAALQEQRDREKAEAERRQEEIARERPGADWWKRDKERA
jgi:hypothetical protein